MVPYVVLFSRNQNLSVLLESFDEFEAMGCERNFGCAPFLDEIGLAKKGADGIDSFGVEACKLSDEVAIQRVFDIGKLGGLVIEAKHERFIFCAGSFYHFSNLFESGACGTIFDDIPSLMYNVAQFIGQLPILILTGF